MGLEEFGLVVMDALIQFLEWVVTELEYWREIELAEQTAEQLEYMDAVAYLDALRATAEYRTCR